MAVRRKCVETKIDPQELGKIGSARLTADKFDSLISDAKYGQFFQCPRAGLASRGKKTKPRIGSRSQDTRP